VLALAHGGPQSDIVLCLGGLCLGCHCSKARNSQTRESGKPSAM
jgi:hypothetical protein